jgi:hypothetical protein
MRFFDSLDMIELAVFFSVTITTLIILALFFNGDLRILWNKIWGERNGKVFTYEDYGREEPKKAEPLSIDRQEKIPQTE